MTDLVLCNGRFYAMAGHAAPVSALVIRNDHIVHAGDDGSARANASTGAEVVDVRGFCGLPGLVDAHMHLEAYALSLTSVDAETRTLEQALNEVARRAAQSPANTWILGRGWNHNEWGGKFPTAQQLDSVAPDHPVRLSAKSGHAAWVNSRALQIAGITRDTPDPAGGEIVRDDAGSPTGVLLEGASRLVEQHIPAPGLAQLVSATLEALARAARLGLTGLHDMDGSRVFEAEQILHERGELVLRILKSIPLQNLDQAIAVGLRSGFGDEWLRIGQVKMFADGALGPRTAWMLEGYETAPDDTGIPITPVGVLRDSVTKANRAGLGCAIHAIGDRACREVLGIFQDAQSLAARLPNRVEHAQILHPDDQRRFAQLGVIASMQPLHATSDMHISDRHLGSRAVRAYPFRSLLDQGAVLAFGSDCPVEVIDPLVGIHAAVTRRRADGLPGQMGWQPDQRLSRMEAIRGFTMGAAMAAGTGDRLGTLEVGKLADITLLDQDIFGVDAMEILDLTVMATIVGGRFVWRDDCL